MYEMKTPCRVLGGQRAWGVDTRLGWPDTIRPLTFPGCLSARRSRPQVWSRLGQIGLRRAGESSAGCPAPETTTGVGGWGAGCWEMREAPGREAPGPWMAGEGCWGTMRGSECKPCAFISSMGSRSALLLSPLTPALDLIVGINVPFSACPKADHHEELCYF